MSDIFQPRRKIQKIFLIRPPLTTEPFESRTLSFPLGLAYLGAVLKQDYEVKLLDCLAEGFNYEVIEQEGVTYGLNPETIRKKIEAFSPDIVGISCLFSLQYLSSLKIAYLVKDINPDIITIMGGAHPSALPQEFLVNSAVDFVLIGEAEESIIQLLEAIKGRHDYSCIDGVAYRKDGKIIVHPKTKYIRDLDRIPFPARDLLPMEIYFRVNRPHGMDSRFSRNTNMITSRGCSAHCVFCSIHTLFSRNYRARSVENVIAEIETLKERYNIKEIQFEDDNLTLDKVRAKRLFREMSKRKLDIVWTAPNGVALWALDEELIDLMRQSGCRHVGLGIESGSQEVLDNIIGKPLNLKKIRPLINKMRRSRIATTSFFIVGFPDETFGQIKTTLRFAESLPTDDINIFFATPYPGTELYKICQDRNLLGPNFNLARLKASNINILPQDISQRKLRKLVAQTVLRVRLKKVVTQPHILIRHWFRRFRKEPRQAFLKVWKLFKDFL
ncbi:MAG: B12-binding domain-containing radical SAM protein [Candidatus Omnitrophica bacterium]|nr:B12-binding domain-containing radical SAM protein [Candidatus Omnitrophota bacterium]